VVSTTSFGIAAGASVRPPTTGTDYFDDTYERNRKLEKFQGYRTDVWLAEATRFIEENQDKPFFLYLPLNAPHSPYIVDPK
jgi:hypothetical protein